MINLLFIAAGIGICGLCFIQISSSVHLRKDIRRYFQLFFLLIIVYIGTHLARQLMEGIMGEGIRSALYSVTFLEMLSAGCMAFMISLLVLAVSKIENRGKIVFFVLVALICIHLVLQIIGVFTDMIFCFDDSNVYHRAPGYLLSNICPLLMLLIDVSLLIIYRKNIETHIKKAFWIYMIAPIIAIIIQSFFYGVQLIIFATVGAAVYMFSVIIKDQNSKYEQQQMESSRLETELTMASSIQTDMLPNIFPAFPERSEFDVYAKMDPAKEVGGDFYDFFLVDDDHLCIIIADVSGKGVPAALFMMASLIILSNHAKMGKTPAQILTDTNETICSNNREEMFVTVWLGILEISTGKLTASNAGHEYPAIKKAGGLFEFRKDKHGLVIGGMDGMKYKNYEVQMEAGSKLFLYTDGVPEATNGNNEMFGTERTLEALNRDPDADPETILKNVRRSVDGFVRDAEQFDDLTMLCVEYMGK